MVYYIFYHVDSGGCVTNYTNYSDVCIAETQMPKHVKQCLPGSSFSLSLARAFIRETYSNNGVIRFIFSAVDEKSVTELEHR